MAEKSKRTCGAPCIINASDAFHLVFCSKEAGHSDEEHGSVGQDILKNTPMTISWKYLGSSGEGGISNAPSIYDRCDTWMRIPSMQKLAPGNGESGPRRTLLTRDISPSGYAAFMCERKPGHDDEHIRSGSYQPLGMSWKIVWEEGPVK